MERGIQMNEENEKLYVLFCCDLWKSTGSMILESVCTTRDLAEQAIVRAIRNGYMKYGWDNDAGIEAMVSLFKEDWELRTLRDVNDKLLCGFLDTVSNGDRYYT